MKKQKTLFPHTATHTAQQQQYTTTTTHQQQHTKKNVLCFQQHTKREAKFLFFTLLLILSLIFTMNFSSLLLNFLFDHISRGSLWLFVVLLGLFSACCQSLLFIASTLQLQQLGRSILDDWVDCKRCEWCSLWPSWSILMRWCCFWSHIIPCTTSQWRQAL